MFNFHISLCAFWWKRWETTEKKLNNGNLITPKYNIIGIIIKYKENIYSSRWGFFFFLLIYLGLILFIRSQIGWFLFILISIYKQIYLKLAAKCFNEDPFSIFFKIFALVPLNMYWFCYVLFFFSFFSCIWMYFALKWITRAKLLERTKQLSKKWTVIMNNFMTKQSTLLLLHNLGHFFRTIW